MDGSTRHGPSFATKQHFELKNSIEGRGQDHQIYALDSTRQGISCDKT